MCETNKESKPTGNWVNGYYIPRNQKIPTRKQLEKQISEEIRNHNCVKSNCGTVCTAFEW